MKATRGLAVWGGIVLAVAASPVGAATRTWTGGAGNGAWATSGNWAQSAPTNNGQDEIYIPVNVQLDQTNNVGNPIEIEQLRLWQGLSALTITGQQVRFNDGSVPCEFFDNSDSAVNFAADINFARDDTRFLGYGTGEVTFRAGMSGGFRTRLHGTYPVKLTAASTYSGNPTVVGGGSFTLVSNGAFSSSFDVQLFNGASLTISNTAAANNINRLNDSAKIVSYGGIFNFLNTGGTIGYTETVSEVQATVGQLTVNMNPAEPARNSDFRMGTFTRTSPRSTVRFNGPSLGGASTSNRFILTSGTMPDQGGLGVIPWAIISRDGGTTYDFAMHRASGDSVSNFTYYYTGAESGWTATTTNARPTADQTLSNNRSLSTLTLDSGIDLLAPAADRTISMNNPSAILQTGGTSIIQTNGANGYSFSSSGSPIYVHVLGTLDVPHTSDSTVPFAFGGGALTKTGPGTLILRGNNSTDINGQFHINEGTVQIFHTNALSSSTSAQIWLNGGKLEIASDTGIVLPDYDWKGVAGDFEIVCDRSTSGSAITHTITENGGFRIPNSDTTANLATLRVSRGGNVTGEATLALSHGILLNINQGWGAVNVQTNAVLTSAGLNYGNNSDRVFIKRGPGRMSLTTAANNIPTTSQILLHLQGGTFVTPVATPFGGGEGLNVRIFAQDGWAVFDITNNTARIRQRLIIGGPANSTVTVSGSGGTIFWGVGSSDRLVVYEGEGGPRGATISVSTINANSQALAFDVSDSTNATEELTVGSSIQGITVTGLVKTNTGTMVLSGANTYTTDTLVRGGTLLAGTNAPVSANGAFGNSANAIVVGDTSTRSDANLGLGIFGAWTNSRTVTVANQGATTTLGGYSGHNSVFAGAVTLSKNVFLTATNSGTCTFNANISGGFGVTKVGPGKVRFANTDKGYTGPTIISNGTLQVDNNLASAITVANGGTLGGTGRCTSVVYVAPGGHLAPGTSIGTLTNATLSLGADSILDFEFKESGNPSNDQVVVSNSGGLSITGGVFNITYENTTNHFSTNGTYYVIAYSGSIGGTGVSALYVTNQVNGKTYTFGTVAGTPNWITLTIAGGASGSPPTISTLAATNVLATSAYLNGNLTSTGGVVTTARVYFNTSDLGTVYSGWLGTNDFGTLPTGALSHQASGLSSNTTYTYRYYATNSAGEGWGSAVSFGTLALPLASNAAASAITASAATFNGYLYATGNAPTTVSVYWGTADPGQVFTGWDATNTFPAGTPVGALATNIAGLLAYTDYVYRFYATNAVGDSWGDPAITFKTDPGPPSISTVAATNILETSAYLNGSLTSTGGAVTTARVYFHTSDLGQVYTGWLGTNSFGTVPAGALSHLASSLSSNTAYAYRYYATNSGGESWGAAVNFTTRGVPVVANLTPTGVTATAAYLNGALTSTGGTVTTLKVFYGTSDGGTTAEAWGATNDFGAVGAGSYSYNATGLAAGSTYYYRFYATNTTGESWTSPASNFVAAITAIWDGDSSTAWGTAANWVGNSLPPSSNATTIVMANGGALNLTSQNQNSSANPFVLRELQFVSGLGTYSLTSGNPLQFDGSGASLAHASANAVDVNVNLQLATNVTLTGAGTGTATLNGAISGAGTLTKSGTSKVTLAGSAGNNTYSGVTTVSGGILELNKGSSQTAIPTDLTINNGGTNKYLSNSDQIADSASVTVNSGGTLDFNARSERIRSLTVNASGTVLSTGGGTTLGLTNATTGVLTLQSGVSIPSTVSTLEFRQGANGGGITLDASAGSGQATINSTLTMNPVGGGQWLRTIQVGDNTGASVDLELVSTIQSGSGNAYYLSKTGAGTLRLSGSSDNTTINGFTNTEGVVELNKSSGKVFPDSCVLTIGDNSATPSNATVRYVTSGDRLGNGDIRINKTGVLDVNGTTDTVGSGSSGLFGLYASATQAGRVTNSAGGGTFELAFNQPLQFFGGGRVDSGSGTFRVNQGGIRYWTNEATGQMAVMMGNLDMGNVGSFLVAVTNDAGLDPELEIQSVISNGGMTKNGAGTLKLSGPNTFTGTMTVNAGTLTYGVNNALLTGALTVDGSTAIVDIGVYTDTVGQVTLANSGQIVGTSGVLASTTTFELQSGSASASLGGAVGFNKSSSGTVTLSGNNSFTGSGTVSGGGVLRLQSTNALGTTAGSTSISGGSGSAIELSGGITYAAEALSLDGNGVSSGGALRSTSGDNTWPGTISVNGGSGCRINSDAGTLTLSSTAASGITGGASLTMGGSGDITVNTVLASTSGLTKDGSGTLTLNSTNTYSGAATVIKAGTMVLGTNAPSGAMGALGNSSQVVNLGDTTGSLNAALVVNGAYTVGRNITAQSGNTGLITLGALNTSGTATYSGTVTLNKSIQLVATNGSTCTFSADISGSGNGITKVGEGTVVYSGAAKTYTGATTISNGTLKVNTTISSPVTVASGGTLGGTGRVNAAVFVAGGGRYAPGNSIGLITNSTLSLGSGSLLDFEFRDSPAANDQIAVTTSGGLSITGGVFSLYYEGTTNTWSTNGTYNLIQYTGAIGGTGVSALYVTNQAAGKFYEFGTSGGWVTLTISTGPSISSASATGVTATAAYLNGTLTATNGQVTTARVYYGTSDGGAAFSGWSFTNSFGAVATGGLSYAASGLTGETTYYYRYYATNAQGEAWSAPVSFTTALNPAAYPFKLLITFAQVPSPLTNFAALVRMNAASLQYFHVAPFASASGHDLRFMNQAQTAELNYELELFDTNATTLAWVQVPTLTNNLSVWAMWGNTSATQPAYTTNGSVWSGGYTSVYHLASSSTLKDSTAGGNTGTSVNNTNTASQIDGGQGFDGSSARVNLTHYNRPANLSIQAWVRSGPYSPASASGEIVGWADVFHVAEFRFSGDHPGELEYLEFDGGFATVHGGNITNNALTHVMMTRDSSGNVRLYTNGIQCAAGTVNLNPVTTSMSLGVLPKASPEHWFKSEMDEVQISSVTRSPDWVLYSYRNQGPHTNNTTYGAVQGTPTEPAVTTLAATNVLDTSAYLNGNLTATNGAVTTARVYYGTSDGGTNSFSAWQATNDFGSVAAGGLSVQATGLSAGTTYYYRYYATNAAGHAWGDVTNFTTLAAPVIASAAASGVTNVAATFNGTLTSTGGTPTTVRVYWGTSDGGATYANWGNTNSFGTQAAGALSTNVTGLSANTTYFYRYYATNAVGESWGAPSVSFTTLDSPLVSSAAASGVDNASATFNGTLSATGGIPTTVTVYWGTSDAGATPAGWSNTNSFGAQAVGALSTNIAGLAANTTYYYRFRAANNVGDSWGAAISFTTLGGPNILTLAAGSVGTTSADLNGNLTSTGGVATTVRVYYGLADAGTSYTGWDATNSFGVQTTGLKTYNATGLTPATGYFYRYYATNTYGESWGGAANFNTATPASGTLIMFK